MQKKGFTLLEVLIVVVILASVVLFAVPSYKKAQVRAQYDAALGTLTQLGEGLRLLYENSGLTWLDDPIMLSNDWFTQTNVSAAEGVQDLSTLNLGQATDRLTFLASLVARGYMARPKNVENGPFVFYVCNQEGDPNFCCDTGDEIACMFIREDDCNDMNEAYSWVRYFKDGHYQRRTDRNCN